MSPTTVISENTMAAAAASPVPHSQAGYATAPRRGHDRAGRGIRANAREQPFLHPRRGGGVDRLLGGVRDGVGGGAQVFVLAARLVVVGDERHDERGLGARQHAQRVERDGLEHRLAVAVVRHDTRSPSDSRMRRKPLRIRVLTVPSGVSVRRASS